MSAAPTTLFTTPADIRGSVIRIVQRNLYAVESVWPRTFAVKWPKEAELLANVSAAHTANNTLKAWAEQHNCAVETVRRNMGSPVPLVSRIIVPNEQTALAIAGARYRAPREKVVARASELERECGASRKLAMRVVRKLAEKKDVDKGIDTDVDFDVFVQAASWFQQHNAEIVGMTAREVPLPGFSAKWLKRPHSHRREAICMLLGIDSLLLRERPGEVRYRYLDPSCAGQPDRLAVSQQQQPEYQVDTAIIIENKDTYQAMPSLPNAVCVFGSGFAVARLPRLLPWLCDPHIRVLYWGDIDAAGFEILSGLRAAGLDCTSMLMDRATYEQYEQFGTKLDADNNSIRHVDPKPASSMHLTNEEYALYRDLRSEEALQYPRIEQERIPLQNALAALTALNIDIRA